MKFSMKEMNKGHLKTNSRIPMNLTQTGCQTRPQATRLHQTLYQHQPSFTYHSEPMPTRSQCPEGISHTTSQEFELIGLRGRVD